MLERREDPNFIINNPPVCKFPAIVEKVTCPICCIIFHKKYAPMISCPSGHTICANCLQGIVNKAAQTPQNPASCPLCRKRIELPLKLNEEYTEFMKLLEAIGEIMFGMAAQTVEIQQKSAKIIQMDSQIKKKNLELFEMSKKMKTAELQRDKLKAQNDAHKKTIKDLRQKLSKRSQAQTDAELDGKQQKQNIKLQNAQQIPNKEVEIDSRPSLKELYYDDELDEQSNRLTLNNKNYKLLQVEFLVFHDLSKISALNLACNQLQNAGLQLLLKNSNFQNLTTLILTNNQITELPVNIETLTRLEYFDIGNYMGEDRQTCNRLRGSSLDKMLEHKWDALKTLTVQFDTDMVWDNEETLDKLLVQWPIVSIINICTFTMKMTKKKCQVLGKNLNNKAKRPGLNRIYVGIRSNQ